MTTIVAEAQARYDAAQARIEWAIYRYELYLETRYVPWKR